jgi:hypothetical protein
MSFLRSTNYNVLGYYTFSKCNVLGYSKLDLQRLYAQPGYQKMSNNEQQLITTELFPSAFNDFKTMIFDYVAIPLLRNEDDFLSNNLYMITIIKNRLNDLTTSFPEEDFTFYKHIVDLISMAFEKTELLDKYEKLLNPSDGVVTLGLQVKRVFLRTEFEIYNIVFGRPIVHEGETYENNRIDAIYKLLHEDKLIRIEDFKERLLET